MGASASTQWPAAASASAGDHGHLAAYASHGSLRAMATNVAPHSMALTAADGVTPAPSGTASPATWSRSWSTNPGGQQ